MVGTSAKVLSSTKLQEVKIGYTHFDWQNLLAVPALATTPNYVFPGGIIFGQRRNYPQEFFQNTISGRYDLTMAADRHDLRSAPSSSAGTTPANGSCCRAVNTSSRRRRRIWRGVSRLMRGTIRQNGT